MLKKSSRAKKRGKKTKVHFLLFITCVNNVSELYCCYFKMTVHFCNNLNDDEGFFEISWKHKTMKIESKKKILYYDVSAEMSIRVVLKKIKAKTKKTSQSTKNYK